MRIAASTSGVRHHIVDDLDALRYSRGFNNELKRHPIYRVIPTRVTRVADGFYITEDMEIAVARAAKVRRRAPDPDTASLIYEGGVVHENLHVLVFPVMPRAREVQSVLVDYLSSRGVKVEPGLLQRVENIVSDVMNEVYAWQVKVPGYTALFATRRYYVEPTGEPLEVLEEKRPVAALFDLHYTVFSALHEGWRPRVDKNLRSHVVYRLILASSKVFDPSEHLTRFNTMTVSVTRPLLLGGLYEFMDAVYEELSPPVPGPEAEKRVARALSQFKDLSPYALYFSLAALYYRLAKAAGSDCGVAKNNTDETVPVPVPDPGDAGEVVSRIRALPLFLGPETIDRAAENLINRALTVRGASTIVPRSRTRTVTTPFYRNPRGRINPVSLLRARRGFLDWEVEEEVEYYTYERAPGPATAPDHFTAVIDASGSTTYYTGILAGIVGHDVSVFDVERTVVLAIMKPILRLNPAATADLYLFSDNIAHLSGRVRDLHERLLDADSLPLELAGTDIVTAVFEAVATHRDSPRNPFILVTDLAVTEREAAIVHRALSDLKRSPVLVVVVGPRLLALDKLNRLRNSAAVTLQTPLDARKLEEAIRKVSTAALR